MYVFFLILSSLFDFLQAGKIFSHCLCKGGMNQLLIHNIEMWFLKRFIVVVFAVRLKMNVNLWCIRSVKYFKYIFIILGLSLYISYLFVLFLFTIECTLTRSNVVGCFAIFNYRLKVTLHIRVAGKLCAHFPAPSARSLSIILQIQNWLTSSAKRKKIKENQYVLIKFGGKYDWIRHCIYYLH